MYQNLTIFKKKLEYYRAVESIKHKKIGNAVKQMIVYPYILLYFGNKLMSVLENKTLALLESNNNKEINNKEINHKLSFKEIDRTLSFDVKSNINNTVNS